MRKLRANMHASVATSAVSPSTSRPLNPLNPFTPKQSHTYTNVNIPLPP